MGLESCRIREVHCIGLLSVMLVAMFPAPPSPFHQLSIATSTSDGTYQPFGPVVDSSSDHKPVPTPPGSGSPWRAPTAAKTSPSSKPAVTTPDDKQTTPKLSPSNNTGSNLSITIDTEVSGRHLGPIGEDVCFIWDCVRGCHE